MTDLILKIDGVKDALSVEFYIEREKTIKFLKEDLIKVYKDEGIEYYAPVNANELGRGHLMAAVEFEDREPMYPGGGRRVVVSGFTGYTIPCMGEGNTISCGDYEVIFKKVKDIPKNEGTKIFVGSVKKRVIGYEYITEEMVKELASHEVEQMEQILNVEGGDRLVVAIPADRDLVAYKDNGFGGKVPFSTSVMGANGLELKIDDIRYKIYGEFITVGGELKIYIE
jgi:hypothetical protein